MSKAVQLVFFLGVSLCLSGCIKDVRVPLPTPLPTVGGARPAVGQGLQFAMAFGDGVWGQEQERAEMAGVGLGVSAGQLVEGLYSTFHSTRKVQINGTGAKKSGSWAHQLRGNRESDRGNLVAILLGSKARLSNVALIGESNLAWTPAMELGGIRSEPGFILLPMLGVRHLVPAGERR